MANFAHRFIVSAALTAAVWLVVQLQPSPASAQECSECCEGNCEGERAPPAVTGTGSSTGSINDLGKQRFNQMITHRVLGTVLLQ